MLSSCKTCIHGGKVLWILGHATSRVQRNCHTSGEPHVLAALCARVKCDSRILGISRVVVACCMWREDCNDIGDRYRIATILVTPLAEVTALSASDSEKSLLGSS